MKWISAAIPSFSAVRSYAITTDAYDAPLRPVRLITLVEATTELPATEAQPTGYEEER